MRLLVLLLVALTTTTAAAQKLYEADCIHIVGTEANPRLDPQSIDARMCQSFIYDKLGFKFSEKFANRFSPEQYKFRVSFIEPTGQSYVAATIVLVDKKLGQLRPNTEFTSLALNATGHEWDGYDGVLNQFVALKDALGLMQIACDEDQACRIELFKTKSGARTIKVNAVAH
ncbi:MAG TPA: hypothetical protein VJ576_20250 [Rhodocyclaceae bacterium]|nr:hypothetical protein [Rhodocyclaceae bacterium]